MGSRRTRAFELVACALVVLLSTSEASDRRLLQTKPVCKPGTYSPTGTNCKPCPPQAMCLRMALPCEMMPTCDPITGRATSMCWVKKPTGSLCNPKFYGDQKIPEAEKTGLCSSEGECLPAGATITNSSQPAQQKPAVLPAKCPSTPLCRRAQGPCDMAPPCDANGKPTSMCWVSKPDGAACSPHGAAALTADATSFICVKQQCIMAMRPPVMPVAIRNTTSSGVAQANSSANGSAAAKCPSVPMCRRLALPCEMAPLCDATGRPTSMCWVAKPDGAECNPGAELASGMKHVCKKRECFPA